MPASITHAHCFMRGPIGRGRGKRKGREGRGRGRERRGREKVGEEKARSSGISWKHGSNNSSPDETAFDPYGHCQMHLQGDDSCPMHLTHR